MQFQRNSLRDFCVGPFLSSSRNCVRTSNNPTLAVSVFARSSLANKGFPFESSDRSRLVLAEHFRRLSQFDLKRKPMTNHCPLQQVLSYYQQMGYLK